MFVQKLSHSAIRETSIIREPYPTNALYSDKTQGATFDLQVEHSDYINIVGISS